MVNELLMRIFSAKFWVHFGIAFALILLCSAVALVWGRVDDLFFYANAMLVILNICWLLLAALPSILVYAFVVALFLAFRTVDRGQFLKTLAASAFLVVLVAVGVWIYSTSVQWQCTARAVGVELELRGTPEEVKNRYAATSSFGVVSHRIDSLRVAYAQEQSTGNYQTLYTLARLREYEQEYWTRYVDVCCLILCWLVFSTLGYWSKKSSVQKILGVVAIVIVCVFIAGRFRASVEKHTESSVRGY